MPSLSLHLMLRAVAALACSSPALAISLAALEQGLPQHDAKTAIARLNTTAAHARQTAMAAENGWSLFAGLHAGHSRETDTGSSTAQKFDSTGYNVGISHPLLGSQQAQQQALADAELQTRLGQLDEALTYRQSLLALRQDYINLWHAEQQQQLASAFLQDAGSAGALLAKRRSEGLLLPSDEQVFLAQFHLAETRRDSAARQIALLQQQLALRSGLPAATITTLDSAPDSLASVPATADNRHPLLQRAYLQWQHQQDALKNSRYSGLESSVYLSYAELHKSTQPGNPNRDLQAGIQLRAPLGLGSLQRAVQTRQLAELDSSARQFEAAGQQLQTDYNQNLSDYQSIRAELASDELFRQASLRALQEKNLRQQSLPGDTREQWLAARFEYYQKASQQLQDSRRLQSTVATLAYHGALPGTSPANPDLAAALRLRSAGQTAVPARFTPPAGAYVWDSTAALAAPSAAIRAWQQYGLNHILLGLTARQLNQPDLGTTLQQLATAANLAGIRLELLLGDASWIQPDGRRQLLTLLAGLRGQPFSGLNLDLEIEQLPQWQTRRAVLTRAWLDTLQAAASAVPWPLAATFHHRHLDTPGLAQALSSHGVRRADIMIFSTRPDTVLAVADKARRQLGGLPFSIVQSVESTLPDHESHARSGLPALQALSASLQQHGSTQLLIQDWANLQRMQP